MVTRQKFLELACAYLADHQQSSGKFTYRLRRDGGKVKRDYNTLRHAGTIYALNQADAHVDRDLTPTIEAALDYLWRWYLVPVPGDQMQYAIASARPGKNGDSVAKIGGIGLSLVAVGSLARSWTGFEQDAVAGMIRFADTLIRPDGSMICKLDFRTGAVSDFISLYYPGEVALGMLLCGVRSGDSAVVETCIRILMYLADLRRPDEDVPPDHWAVLATAKLFELANQGQVDLDDDTRVLLYYHGIQVVEKIQRIAAEPPQIPGSLVDNGQCCSIATRLEALTAFQPWLKQEDYPGLDEVDRLVSEGVDYLLKSQYQNGMCVGGLPWIPASHPHSKKRADSNEVRVDTVQHSISAVVGAQAIDPRP